MLPRHSVGQGKYCPQSHSASTGHLDIIIHVKTRHQDIRLDKVNIVHKIILCQQGI